MHKEIRILNNITNAETRKQQRVEITKSEARAGIIKNLIEQRKFTKEQAENFVNRTLGADFGKEKTEQRKLTTAQKQLINKYVAMQAEINKL
ncbi:unknown [Bacteroides sp. CAG:633]|uniref:hypothetical protein n=1 Tax=Bacteroides sp. CAG:633 TaxID=1262744 RepID=UPI0003379FC0|nr:hypothetical protein [Bacteroides sp. CAG:633]CDB11703.1 unknown [Bacteroides sp. CAG:633]